MAKVTYSNAVKQALLYALGFAALLGVIIIGSIRIHEHVTAEPPGPYATANQPILESARPGDLIVCTVQNSVPPTTENVSKSGLVIHNVLGRDRLGIILFNELAITEIILEGVKYFRFDDCEVSIVKDPTEQVKIIGEAVLNGSQAFIE